MTGYNEIPDAEIDPNKPALSSTMVKMRDNPLSIMEGDASAIAEGLGVWVEKSGQTALLTDETDTDKVLAPDGAGSVRWVGTTVDKAGSGKDGTVTAITAGCYEAQAVTITTTQTLTGPVEIRCQGAVAISGIIIGGSYPIIIRAAGNVSLVSTSGAHLFVDAGGTLTVGSGASVSFGTGTVVLRSSGNLTTDGATVTCGRFAAQSLAGTVTLGAVTAQGIWGGGAGPRPGVNGAADARRGGPGGGGGHAGGAGGAGDNDGTGAPGSASWWLSSSRAYLRTITDMQEGSGGSSGIGSSSGSSWGTDGAGGVGGGVIFADAFGAMVISGALSSNGANGTNGALTFDASGGGGGGGVVRLSCGGSLTFSGAPTISANGGNGATAGHDGGGGGGGMVATLATSYIGTKTISVTGGTGYAAGSSGTAYEATFTSGEIAGFRDSGFFAVTAWAADVTAAMEG